MILVQTFADFIYHIYLKQFCKYAYSFTRVMVVGVFK